MAPLLQSFLESAIVRSFIRFGRMGVRFLWGMVDSACISAGVESPSWGQIIDTLFALEGRGVVSRAEPREFFGKSSSPNTGRRAYAKSASFGLMYGGGLRGGTITSVFATNRVGRPVIYDIYEMNALQRIVEAL